MTDDLFDLHDIDYDFINNTPSPDIHSADRSTQVSVSAYVCPPPRITHTSRAWD